MAEKRSSGRGRTRNFGTVVYPESAPENWQSILAEMCIPCFVSPLHDKDENPGGEPKKPHYHVMLMYEGVKTADQAQEVFDQIGGVGCEIVQSIRGYARYLCHLDNPEKAQYNPDDVLAYGGADYISTIGLVIDKYKAIGEMMEFCVTNDVYGYATLLMWCKVNNPGWFRVLCDNGTVVMKEFLKSLKWESQQLESLGMDDLKNINAPAADQEPDQEQEGEENGE